MATDTRDLHDWQKAFFLKDQLTQGDFEALETALVKLLSFHRAYREMSVGAGAYLRAAIQAGWIEEPEVRALTDDNTGERAFFYDGKDVNEMHPAVVKWLGDRVMKRHDAIINEDVKNL